MQFYNLKRVEIYKDHSNDFYHSYLILENIDKEEVYSWSGSGTSLEYVQEIFRQRSNSRCPELYFFNHNYTKFERNKIS